MSLAHLLLWFLMYKQTTVTMGGQFRASSSVQLTWNPSADVTVTGYDIYRLDGNQQSNYDLVASSVACCQFDDHSVESGHTYTYRGRAVDGVGGQSNFSDESNVVTIP